jgi:hypothetical protein
MSSILQQGEFNHYTVTEHGITFKTMTPEGVWLKTVEKLCSMFEGAEMTRQKALMLLADALNFGQDVYGERFAQAINGMRQALGLTPKTIANAQAVYKRIEPSRRRDGLTLGHMSVIAALPADAQDRFMDMALADPLHTFTVEELKNEVATQFPETKRGKPRKKKERPVEETSATVHQKLIDVSNWFSEHDPIEKMKGPLAKLHLVFRRKWHGRKRER